MNDDLSQKKMGKYMLIGGWVLGLALLASIFQGWLDQQKNPNQRVYTNIDSKGAHEVTLKRNRQGHYVASGKINHIPVTFLLDTGATGVAIPEHVAEQAGLQKGPTIQSITANGTINVHMTRLDRISLGQIELRDIKATINPYMDGDTVLLGMTFLKHLELVQRGDNLTLRY